MQLLYTFADAKNAVREFVLREGEREYAHPFDLVVAIARGGLVPGVMLSHALNLPLEIIHAKSYAGREAGELIIKAPDFDTTDKNILLVDDIYDTGATMRQCSSLFKKVTPFVLVTKQDIMSASLKVNANTWVEFEWE